MKSSLLLISAVFFYSCDAWSLNPITNVQTAMNKTRETINEATEYGRSLREYSEKTLNEAKNIRSLSDATNLGYKVTTDQINYVKQYGEEKLNNITEYGKEWIQWIVLWDTLATHPSCSVSSNSVVDSLTKETVSNLIEYGEKTVNEVKNVRSIDDVAELGKVNLLIDQKEFDHDQSLRTIILDLYDHLRLECISNVQNIVNDRIKEAKSFVKKDPVLEAQKRQKIIMNDCISAAFSDLNPTQLADFIHVSNNLTAIVQMAFDEAAQSANPPPAETGESQQTMNAQPNSEEPMQPPVLDFGNIGRLLSAFEVMKHIGTIVPKCFSISDQTVQKFMDSN